MPPTRAAEQALALYVTSIRPQYVCRACRARTSRSIHTTSILAVEERGFFKRVREGIFGSKQSRDAKAKRDEKAKQQAKEQEEGKFMTDQKGNTYRFAAIVDNTIDPRYNEASTSHGLRHVGGERWIRRTQDRGEPYVGFMSSDRKVLSATEWQRLLRHVTIEAVALHAAGRDINDISLPRNGPSNAQLTRGAALALDKDTGRLTVTFDAVEAKDKFLKSIPSVPKELEIGEEAVVAEETAVTAKAADSSEQATKIGELVEIAAPSQTGSRRERNAHLKSILPKSAADSQSEDFAWVSMPIREPLVKFGIVKRIAQLTGHRISDPIASGASTLADLHAALTTKEQPKKLAQSPELQRLSASIPNVQVHKRRQTPRDKSKAVGRWKLIKNELLTRGLLVVDSQGRTRRPRAGMEQ